MTTRHPGFSKRGASRRIGGVVGAALAAAAALFAQTAGQAQEMDLQWPTYNGQLDGQRFSPLKAITSANAAELGEVCRVQVDGPTAFSSGLIVVDGVIYASTGRTTVALDARTCAVKWKYVYAPEEDEVVQSTRGVAVLNGKVYRGTGDGRLIALDAATGRLLWKDVIGAPRLGEFAASAPLAWQGVVYMGVAGGDRGARGRVLAFDAETGRELWRFNTVPMGSEVGADTWKRRESARTGGGGVWGAMSLDVTTDELFVPVGNPWPDIAFDYRPGLNLFTNSMVVLDAKSGRLKWWFQSVSPDKHDLDLTAAPVLYRDSRIRDLMVFGGKDGHVTAVDRDSHRQVFRTPVVTIENETASATPQGVHICPGFAGGIQWNGPTLDRLNRTLVVGGVDWCMTIVSAPVSYKPPQVGYGGFPKPDKDARGTVTALDSETGAIRWQYRADKPVIAGVTPTAGGVIFTGDMDGNFLVLDSRTGAVLKKAPTGGAIAGGVVTYEIGGRQYVALTSGNVSRNTWGVSGAPSVVIMALGGSATPAAAPASPATAAAGPPSPEHGRALFGQVCASCHGPDGDMIADHRLSNVRSRRDFASTVAFIKSPDPPMPKLFPGALTEKDVQDLAAYLQQGVHP